MKNLKKEIFLSFITLVMISVSGFAQIKIGDNPTIKNANAMLEIESTNKGLLMPRIALTSSTSIAPFTASIVAGMTIYNTATLNDVLPGFYYYDGTKWVRVADATATGIKVANNGLTISANTVQLGGPLITPTTVTTNATNTLSVVGLQTGVATDELVMSSAGVLKKITPASLLAGTTTVLNSSTINTANVTVNGVTSSGAPIINSNTLMASGNNLTSTVNGVASSPLDLTPLLQSVTAVSNTSTANDLTTTVNGVTGAIVPMINSNSLTASGSNLTSTVNGVASAALDLTPILQSATVVSNTSTANDLTTTVNGVTGTVVPMINSNALTASGSNLTSTVNGIASTALDLTPILQSATVVSNTSTANDLTTTVNGVTGAVVPMINSNSLTASGSNLTSTVNGIASTALDLTPILQSATVVSNTSTANDLTTTVNGVTGAVVPMINSNSLTASGSNLTSTVNGVASTALDLTPILQSATVVSNTSTANDLTTTVNGVTGAIVPMINSNSLTASGNNLTSTVNGVASSPLDLTPLLQSVTAVSNTSTANDLTTTVNGVTGAIVPMINSNSLTASGSNLTSTVNGIASTALDLTPILQSATVVSNTSTANDLTTTVNGVTGAVVPMINSNSLTASGSNLTSTVNGVASTALDLTPILQSATVVSNTSTANDLTTTVNGVTGAIVPMINSNSLTASGSNLTSTVNGIASTALDLTPILQSATVVSNTSTANDLTTTVNGVTGAIVPMINSNALASSANTLTSTVNGVTGTTAPIVNSNALTASGSNLTSTVNGIASTALDLTPILQSATVVSNTSTANNLTTTVNGVTGAIVPMINSNALASSANTLTSTVNGIVGTTAPIVNSNSLTASGNNLTSTVNGIASTALDLTPILQSATVVSNTSTANDLTTTVNGVTGAIVPMINSNALASSANTLTSTVNGVTGTTAPIVNSNALTASGSNLTSTVNGIASTALDLTPILQSATVVSNTSTANDLTTTVNGVTGAIVPMINSNSLTASGNNLTSTVNGVASSPLDLTPLLQSVTAVSNTSTANDLTTTVNGVTGAIVPMINSNSLTASGSNLTSTVNGIASTALDLTPILQSATVVSNTSTANDLTTTVNGVTGTVVPMINSNALTASGSNLTSTVNGVASTALDLTPILQSATVVSNTSTANDLTTTVNGVTGAIVPMINSNALASSANTLTSTVNGVTGTTAPIVNSNSLTASGSNLTSTVNGIASTALDLTPILQSATVVSNTSTANDLTTTVNGVTGAVVPMINSNALTSSANTLTSTVNGVTGTTAPIVNSNALTASGSNLTSTVNGIASTALDLTPILQSATVVSNTSTANNLTTTVNGVTGAIVPMINSNALASSANTLTSTVNGIVGTTAPIVNSNSLTASGNNLTSTVNGIASTALDLTPILQSATVVSNTSTANDLTTTVNGVTGAIVPMINSNALASSANTLTSTVNGVTGTTAPIVNSNALTASGSNLTSTVNGIASAALDLTPILQSATVVSNTSTANDLTTTVNGVTGAIVPMINSNALASSANTLTSTVNGVTGTTAPIVNSNALTASGSNLTSTVNGIASTALDLTPILQSATVVSNTSTANNLTTTVNGVTGAIVPMINSNALASSANTLTSTVNGIVGTTAPIVNSNSLTASGNNLTSTVNGIASTALDLTPILQSATVVSNTSTANDLTTTVNGVTGAIVPMINSNALASSANTLTSTVNGVTGTTAPIVNSNALTASGSNLTSTVNGIASAALDLTPILQSATVVSNTSTANDLTTTVNGVTGAIVPMINSNALTAVNGKLISTVNGIASAPSVDLIITASNGLTATNGDVKLGGILTDDTLVEQSNFSLAFTSDEINGFSVDGTTFSVDAGQNRVGIGTIAPENQFHVVATDPFSSARWTTIEAANGTEEFVILTLNNSSPLATGNKALIGFTNTPGAPGANWAAGTVKNDIITSPNPSYDETFSIMNSTGGSYQRRFNITPNGNVGIGTTTPSQRLEVVGNVKFSGALMPDNEAGTTGEILTSDGPNNPPRWVTAPILTNIYTDNGTLEENRIVTQDDKTLEFTSTVVNCFSVDGPTLSVDAANDRVGIGTINPENQFHVVSSAVNLGRWTTIEAANNTGERGILAIVNSSPLAVGNRTLLGFTNNGPGSGGANWAVGTVKNDAFDTGGNETFSIMNSTGGAYLRRIDITPNGNVGIGTETPSEKLEVLGNIKFSGTLMPNNLPGTSGQILTSAGAGAPPTWETASVTSNIYTANGSLTGNRTIDQAANTLEFTSTAVNGFSVDGTTLSVDAVNNRVGIGTIAPTQALDVIGSVKFSSALMPNNLPGTLGQILTSAGAGAPPTWGTAPVTSNIYTANGSLTGNRTIDQAANTLEFTSTAVNGFSVDGTTLSVDAVNNRVGIGTIAPTQALDVTGSVKFSSALMPNNLPGTSGQILTSAGAGAPPTWGTAPVTSNLYTADGTLTGARIVTQAANTLAFTSTAVNGFSVDGTTLSVDAANNRVGIGTITPTQALDVTGSVKFSSALMPNNLPGTSGQILTSAGAGAPPTWGTAPVTSNLYTADGTLTGARTVTQAGNTLAFTSTAVNGFSVDGTTLSVDAANNRVGIGTATPENQFHVVSTTLTSGRWTTIEAANSTTEAGILAIKNSSPLAVGNRALLGFTNNGPTSGGANWAIGTVKNDALSTGGNETFSIMNSTGGSYLRRINITPTTGYVGIGTTDPIAPLHVAFSSSPTGGYTGSTSYFRGSTTVTALTNDNTLSNNVSIYADGDIVSRSEIVATSNVPSDMRLKKESSPTNNEQDLMTLNNISIKDYKMIDNVRDPKVYKKVIAQELAKVYPIAVRNNTKWVIPSVYKIAKSVKSLGGNQYAITLENKHDFRAGDTIEIEIKDKAMQKTKVIAIQNEYEFEITNENPFETVFVYGKEINDLQTVDYDAVSMLNVSASQALSKKLEVKDVEIKELKDEIKDLKAEIEAIKAIINKK